MTGLEVVLLLIGLIVIVASFVFSSGKDGETSNSKAELTDKQKDDIKKQILTVFDEQMEDVKERIELNLDKISAQKMNEMNEYSETILGEINKNHNEVMFLYDMLNEKKKEINITVRDINAAKKEIEEVVKLDSAATAEESSDVGFMASEAIMKSEKKTAAKTPGKKVLDQLDAAAETVSDGVAADETAVEDKPKKKTPTARTAAKRTRTAVKKETVREDNKDPKEFETGNNNEKILRLNAQGKSNVEIAKELGLGIGEVKLVIDLFRGGRR